jgi:hypothetical protein
MTLRAVTNIIDPNIIEIFEMYGTDKSSQEQSRDEDDGDSL